MQSSPCLFYASETKRMWDTWLYYHNEKFYLYYMTGPIGAWNGIAMATSHDGLRWEGVGKVLDMSDGMIMMGAGSVYSINDRAIEKTEFIMNFCESEGDWKTTIFFAKSQDLIHWERLDSEYEFPPDEQWYKQKGRWENIWTLPRPGGGLYGYWAATLKENRPGLGFGETLDGVTWKTLKPPVLQDLVEAPEPDSVIYNSPEGAIWYRSPEIGAIHERQGKYYAVLGLYDLEPMLDGDFKFRPGETTFVGSSPFGPFAPATKNRRLLVGNASYFCRFLETPDGILVNHHSWKTDISQVLGVDPDHVYMAPLKRAIWDEDGTLRLMWWDGYEKAKEKTSKIDFKKLSDSKTQLGFTDEKSNRTLILEGRIDFKESKKTSTKGLYFQCQEETIAFILHSSGIVEYGSMTQQNDFIKEDEVDRELEINTQAHFRLVKKGRITEFYLNNFLMHCYCLPGDIEHAGLLGPLNLFDEIMAWHI